MLFAGCFGLSGSLPSGLGCFLCLDDLQTGELFPVLFIQRVGNELYRTLQIGDHHILQGVARRWVLTMASDSPAAAFSISDRVMEISFTRWKHMKA